MTRTQSISVRSEHVITTFRWARVPNSRLLPMQPADKSNLIRSEAELKLEQVRYLPLTDAGVLGVLIRCLTSLAKTKQSG